MQSESHALLELFGEALAAEPDSKPLQEAFSNAMAMLRNEDVGWENFVGGGYGDEGEQFGLSLENLKQWGAKIDESVIGAPWMGSGFRRRRDYIWKDGLRHGNIPKPTQGKRNIQEIIDRPMNQMNFFGPTARHATEKRLYTSGISFWIGHDTKKDLTSIPLRQITDQILEPNGLGYAIAYKREWSERNLAKGTTEKKVLWYFVEEFKNYRVKEIKIGGGEAEPVSQDHVIFDMHANRSAGLVYGAPDALATYVWNSIVRDSTLDGRSMTKALATFALKASVKTKSGGQNAAMQLATTEGAGNTAVLGQANDLVPLASAGKGYDFSGLVFLLAIVATSLDLSVIDISASPGDAGSSYGAGQLMSLPTRLAMMARREEHVALEKRVLRWMGIPNPDVHFKPFESGEEVYRSLQSLVLLLNNGTHSRQEIRDLVDDLLGQPDGAVPTDDKQPAVLLAKALAKAAPKPAAPEPAADDGASAPQTASPNQGRSNGTGGQSGAGNDIRR